MRSIRSFAFGALAIGAALAMGELAGCAGINTAGLPEPLTGTINQVQKYTVAACAFLPTVETVAAIFAKGSPTLATATAVGAAICGAVGAPAPAGNLGARLGASSVAVAGVKIEGDFIKPR
jgi:hypothetical protein